MTTDSGGIGKGVLIATLGTVAGALVLRSLGYLPTLGHWIAEAFFWLLHALAYSVPVPVVVLAICAGFALYVWRSAVLHRESLVKQVMTLKARSAEAFVAANAEPAPLTDNEIAVLRLLARADGKWMGVMELARRAALANLIAEQAVDGLRDRGYLKHSVGIGTSSYRLSPAGRDYAIAKGYVPPPPTATERRALW